jgi:hypothetical protein
MATDTTFNSMLKKYMPYNLMVEEVMKRDYFLNKVTKDQGWKNGEIQFPFMGGQASSFAFGALTAEADITEDRPVLGTISSYKEIWGSMVFNDRDLSQHGDMKTSFLKILPDRLEVFVDYFKQVASMALMNGTHLASFDAANAFDNLAAGIIGVDRPARLTIGQYLEVGIVGTLRATGYIKSIKIDESTIELVPNKDLSGAGVDLAAAGVIAGDKFFVRGGTTASNGFTSLKSQLLSLSNGGSTSLFGVNKLLYPYLQCPNFDGSGITATTLIEKLFDFWTASKVLGKGNPTEAIMSYKHLGSAMKQLETGNGLGGQGRQYVVKDTRASVYGWTEIDIVGVKGKFTLIGVQEMDDDVIYLMDWRSLKLHSNQFFERRSSPDGKEYFDIRSTTGYKYIVDTRFYGDLIVHAPSYNGIIHSVSY